MADSVTVRRIRRDEGPVLMHARLEALLDAPDAFESTYQTTLMRPLKAWHQRAESASDGDDEVILVAETGSRWVGMAGAFTSEEGAKIVYGMWVHPTWRRRGLATGLLNGIRAWASKTGTTDLRLWVVENNVGAISLYRANGFMPTGGRGVTAETLDEIEMGL